MTSASNEGDRCDVQGVYSWCAQQNSKLLPDLIKTYLKPAVNASQERCVAMDTSNTTDISSALTHVSCASEKLPFICEPLCMGPTCPAASGCAKNVSHSFKIDTPIYKRLNNRLLYLGKMTK
jgi:hypothetical protein